MFVNNVGSSIPTQLAFVKGDDGTYEIAGAQSGETMLIGSGANLLAICH